MRLGFENAALDAKLLTGHSLGLTALDMAVRETEPVSNEAAAQVALLLERRVTGESVARIIGEREFYGLAFGLNEATLEPRPETELLVDLALQAMPSAGRLLDLGTGTGCIPVSILANRSDARAVAVDLSDRAIEAARANAVRHGLSQRIDFQVGSWFDPLVSAGMDRFDLIVSNPPYIVSEVVATLQPEVKDFDPQLALDGGADGLSPYRTIVGGAPEWLTAGGRLMVEIGYDQAEAVSMMMIDAGFEAIAVHRDLNGHDRVVTGHHA